MQNEVTAEGNGKIGAINRIEKVERVGMGARVIAFGEVDPPRFPQCALSLSDVPGSGHIHLVGRWLFIVQPCSGETIFSRSNCTWGRRDVCPRC